LVVDSPTGEEHRTKRPVSSSRQAREKSAGELEGFTTEEIAAKLGCAPRTVERRLRLIRLIWEKHCHEQGSQG
jgi:DNA-directed RNA polymerase specialized sigma24 family protein